MFSPVRITAQESACRTQSLPIQLLIGFLKMQGSDSGRPTSGIRPSNTAGVSATQPGSRIPMVQGRRHQQVCLPSAFSQTCQGIARNQYYRTFNTTSQDQRFRAPLYVQMLSTTCSFPSSSQGYFCYPAVTTGRPSTNFPLPPKRLRQSYHTGIPSYHMGIPSSTSTRSCVSQSTGGDGTLQDRARSEQSYSKRSLNNSHMDTKKLRPSPGSSGLNPENQQTTSTYKLQERDVDHASGKEESTTARSEFQRKWQLTPFGKIHRHHQQPGMEVSLLCYNILAQCLIEMNSDLYHHCQQHVLDWDYRKANLLRELRQNNADIFCLQEVQACHFQEFFSPELEKLGYSSIYQKRTGDKQDGCAIFYKHSKFTLEKSKRVEFYRPNIQLLDRDNVAVVALLRPTQVSSRSSPPRLCVATTHLLYNPRRGDIKLTQLGVLLAEIDRMAAVQDPPSTNPDEPQHYHPIILCGDFNSIPHSPLFTFIRDRQLDYVGLPRALISGQGSSGMSINFLSQPLWPYNVGVTDECQYRRLDREAMKNNGNDQQNDKKSETLNTTTTTASNSVRDRHFSKCIRHPFHLQSVHSHRWDETRRVTTNHSCTNCAVDYIFFSQGGASRRRPPGNMVGGLKLLSQLCLLTDAQATDMGGLPNHAWSSDHFSLQAKFLLS